jgi:hypothetical protein
MLRHSSKRLAGRFSKVVIPTARNIERKGTGNFEQWQNVGKYYLRVSAPKTQCPGATSAPCTCELQRKPLPSRKRNRRSDAPAISVHPGSDDFAFDSVRFAKRAFGNRQTLKIREERPPSNWGEAISNPARIHQIPSFRDSRPGSSRRLQNRAGGKARFRQMSARRWPR